MKSSHRTLIKLTIGAVIFLIALFSGQYFYTFLLINKRVDVKVAEFKTRINKNQKFDLIIDEYSQRTIPQSELNAWIEEYVRLYSGNMDLRIATARVRDYIIDLFPLLSIDPINAKLKFSDNNVGVSSPSTKGRRVNIERTTANIITALIHGRANAVVEYDFLEPDISLDKINDLGINTLIGQGESDFSGSPQSRIHNIKIGISKFNGTIIKPGEEFSFNNLLGEVDEKSGYQAELVIKSGKLLYEYGGGLCQVSTTMFRAAIESGLSITERRNHSFPVRYYNPQGYDSTIYPGIVDLKFINDTSSYVLIQGRVEESRLIFEMYGSDDGRKVAVNYPVIYDSQSSGAIKTYFTREIVYAGGETKKDIFYSNYNPPPKSPLERNPLE